jgi:hypothetical protein
MKKINIAILIIVCFAVIISLWDILYNGDGYLLGMVGLPLLVIAILTSIISLVLTKIKKR